jgi:hypothetical protein
LVARPVFGAGVARDLRVAAERPRADCVRAREVDLVLVAMVSRLLGAAVIAAEAAASVTAC